MLSRSVAERKNVGTMMTRRDVSATMQDLLGVDIGVGSVQKAWEETADAVEARPTRNWSGHCPASRC